MPVSSHGHTPRANIDPICSSTAAMSVFTIQLTRPLRYETLVMFIDSGGCGRSLVTVSGTTDPFSMVEIAETMAMTAAENADISGFALASVRPSNPIPSDQNAGDLMMAHDNKLWSEADSVVNEFGLVLYDWMIIGRNGALSMCNELGLVSRWPARASRSRR